MENENQFGVHALHVAIPKQIILDCKAKGWHYKEIFLLGYKAKIENPQLIARINIQESKLSKMAELLDRYTKRVVVLEAKLKELGQDVEAL